MKQLAAVAISLVLALAPRIYGQQVSPQKMAQLFYVFSTDDASQRAGARLLEEWVYRQKVRVIGIVRHQGDISVMEQFRLAEGISYPLICASAARSEPGLPADLDLENEAGYALLLDGAGQQAAAGIGAELPRIMERAAALVQGGVSTEVDESTWGKVKEIFK